MSTRITWRDVARAARNLAEVARAAGYPCPPQVDDVEPTLTVAPGSVTNGHAADMTWTGPAARAYPVPGGQTLARSARDSYDMIAERTNMLRDLMYQQRRHQEPTSGTQ